MGKKGASTSNYIHRPTGISRRTRTIERFAILSCPLKMNTHNANVRRLPNDNRVAWFSIGFAPTYVR
eukprot:jgi/Psemu1/303312/fgenesh1_kg.99_\